MYQDNHLLLWLWGPNVCIRTMYKAHDGKRVHCTLFKAQDGACIISHMTRQLLSNNIAQSRLLDVGIHKRVDAYTLTRRATPS